MGRYPSIAADKQKTGAARGKLYAMYAKEIYSAAKKSVAKRNPGFQKPYLLFSIFVCIPASSSVPCGTAFLLL